MLNIIFGIVGVISLLLTIYFYKVGKEYPAELTCDNIEKISINAPDKLGKSRISLLLDGEVIEKPVTYVKYLLVSVGNRDVVCGKDDKISFELPQDSRWLSFNLVGKSECLKDKTIISKNVAYVIPTKMRVNESAIVEGVFESKNGDAEVEVSHRILNTKDIIIKESLLIPSVYEIADNLFKSIFTIIAIVVAVVTSYLVLPIDACYYVKNDGSTRVYVEAKLKYVDSVFVREPGHSVRAPEPEMLSYEEFRDNYTRYNKTDRLIKNSNWFYGLTLLMFFFMLVAMWIKPVRTFSRRKRNKKIYVEILRKAKK